MDQSLLPQAQQVAEGLVGDNRVGHGLLFSMNDPQMNTELRRYGRMLICVDLRMMFSRSH